ncbi:hypothetical protein EDD15DRAFT_2377924 [Pisolithus albus]|nr:hypothetical protein EDD15DRAFT_2377924 [Pisolithus albus]
MLPLHIVFEALDQCQMSVAGLIMTLLTCPQYENHPFVVELVERCGEVFNAFLCHSAGQHKFAAHSFRMVENTYLQELCSLASDDNGQHFRASSASTKQLEEFSLQQMAQKIEEGAPKWWSLLGSLLDQNASGELGGEKDKEGGESELEGVFETFWDDVDEIDLEGMINELTGEWGLRPPVKDMRAKRRSAMGLMVRAYYTRERTGINETQKKTIISSIVMHGLNQKSNALQSLLGLFLQSAHAPYKVIDTLAHLGISVSTDTINRAIQSLSQESQNSLQRLGQSLLASYAYDNFDVDLKHDTPTVEKSNDSLKHLTSGLMFPLVHGVTLDDLKCSEDLWRKSALNPLVDEPHTPPKRAWWDLLERLQPERSTSSMNASCRNQFNSWMFLHDLCAYGPEYFHQFKSMIRSPEPVEQIPTVKTPIFAARAMDINNSTVSGNIQAVMELLEQGRVEDPAVTSEAAIGDLPDISKYVVLMHGDLGTGERLQAAQLRRSIESTSWNRLQHIIFIPGLFHLKMACADALWRCFIYPSTVRKDETSLMRDVAQLRPRETGIFATKPGFRRMHQLVGYAGICRRLDCWRVHACKQKGFSSLEAFAHSKPTLDDLKAMAEEITCTYVATSQFRRMRRRQEMERDLQFENALLLNKYFLLYEELSYAMNSGDIGRVEASVVSWVPILKAIGKHKYATQMTNFLYNVHFVYPPGLRHAIRYHVLVNPTGRPMKWRAVDWCVELNNLFTKVKNGGKNSNRSVERIILESPLVQVYRNLQGLVQRDFSHTHLTTSHAPPDMRQTFRKIQGRLELNSPHEISPGRKSRHQVEDLQDKGREMMEKAAQGDVLIENEGDGIEALEGGGLGDIIVELL